VNETKVENYAETIARIARQADIGKPITSPEDSGAVYAIVPQGHTLQVLPRHEAPLRHRGTVHLRDVNSFIRYLTEMHDGLAAIVYATKDPARFVAILNEHTIVPGFRDWRAEFLVPASQEWLRWTGANRKQMGQVGFAEFLEDNCTDVVSPDGARLMDMVLNFETTRDASFRSYQRLQDGTTRFAWVDEERRGAGEITIPPRIELSIPVFEHDEPSTIAARLKYRVKEAQLSIWFELERPHKAVEARFSNACDKIIDAGLTLLMGRPD
jgi:uncharacterized protein YfdQ (DUF2303 family)